MLLTVPFSSNVTYRQCPSSFITTLIRAVDAVVCLTVWSLPLFYDTDNVLRLRQCHFQHRSYIHRDGLS